MGASSPEAEGNPAMARVALSLLAGTVVAAGVVWQLAQGPAVARGPLEMIRPQVPAAALCLRFNDTPPDISDEDAFRRGLAAWIAACRKAAAEDDNNSRLKLSLAQALSAQGEAAEAVAIWRALSARGSAEGLYQLYERHKSFDQRADRPPLVPRAEAERALRLAAELDHPAAMRVLAIQLERGGILKRDAAGARRWTETAIPYAPAADRADLSLSLARQLAKSDNEEERRRGLAQLEDFARQGRGDAKAYLANAIRGADPVRARALYEEAVRSFPGHAVAGLADMLIKGEGGPKDERRGVALLTRNRSLGVGSITAALARLQTEGRLVPRDLVAAAQGLGVESQWYYEAKLELARFLADFTEVRITNPQNFLYGLTVAAELDEPGAAVTLAALKLSHSIQFRDVAGGCTLARKAAEAGDAEAKALLTNCGS
jgi:TPR repeat protein